MSESELVRVCVGCGDYICISRRSFMRVCACVSVCVSVTCVELKVSLRMLATAHLRFPLSPSSSSSSLSYET